MRYALSVEIKLTEMPEEEPVQEDPAPGSDPAVGIQNMMVAATKLLRQPGFIYPMQPAGLDFRKQVAVTVSNFATLAIIEQYESLTKEIQLERP